MLVGRVRQALPRADVVLTVDEPLLSAVHAGEVPFSSGFRHHRPVPSDELVAGLRRVGDSVRSAGARFGVHSCGSPVWPVLADLRPDWFSLDVSLLTEDDTEPFGNWLESGRGTVWGVWPTTGPVARDEAEASLRLVAGWLQRLGLGASTLRAPMAVSPRCGLAVWTPLPRVLPWPGCGRWRGSWARRSRDGWRAPAQAASTGQLTVRSDARGPPTSLLRAVHRAEFLGHSPRRAVARELLAINGRGQSFRVAGVRRSRRIARRGWATLESVARPGAAPE